MSENDDKVLYEVRPKYAVISINNPPVNACGRDVMKGIYLALEKANNDPKVKCVVLKSEGTRLYCAGIDTTVFTQGKSQEYMLEFQKYTRLNTLTMYKMKKPIINIVQGSAVGYGMMMMFACDLHVFADRPIEEMFFKMPEMELGLYTQAGASVGPLLNFGLKYAKNILLTSDKFGLEELKNMNFPTRIFPWDENFEKNWVEFVEGFAKNKEAMMYLIKSTLHIMNDKYIERWFDLEDEAGDLSRGKKKSMKEWDEVIQDLHNKYP